MTTRFHSDETGARSDKKYVSCVACVAYELDQCRAFSEATTDRVRPSLPLLQPAEYTAPARPKICHERDWHETVSFICQGWAASSVRLADGRRQILSFLLPGDIVSATLLFEPTSHCMIETITEVRYRNFKRAELQKILFEHPDLIQPLSKTWIGEKLRADQLAIDLGRRTAHERIARLILNLMEWLAARGMMRGETMDFPLRQTHIADATGLTPVHVSTVLTEFRRNGLVGISERSITILNLSELRRAANER
jgi:CRP/FNR family transcriptional regulator